MGQERRIKESKNEVENMSEASARMHLRDLVREDDVDLAIKVDDMDIIS